LQLCHYILYNKGDFVLIGHVAWAKYLTMEFKTKSIFKEDFPKYLT